MIIPICILLAVVLAGLTLEQDSDSPPSPCPSVFTYDQSGSVPGRWSGVIHLSTDSTLYALWLKIGLDGKAKILGNWVGFVTSEDNMNYKIENTNLKIIPGTVKPVHFFVNFDPSQRAPRLSTIIFNGREICNSETTWEMSFRSGLPRPSVNEAPLQVEPIPNQVPKQDTFYSDFPREQIKCGKVALNAVPLVLHGAPTTDGEWPWQIALYQIIYKTVDGSLVFKCGGTLVSHKHVITAAHCVTDTNPLRLIDHNTLSVYLGKNNLTVSDDKMQVRFLRKITVHPNYNPNPHQRDVAILELRQAVTYTDWVRPACLWPDNDIDLESIIGKKGSVVGWGFDDTGVPTVELKHVEMPVVSQETCLYSHYEFFSRYISDYTYCAGYRDGTSVCKGDSGGGMMFEMDGIWYLRGLVSLAKLGRTEIYCDPSHYIIFTDLAKYLPWIYENVSDF